MAECLLRRSGAFHDVRSSPISAPIPMRKQLTGEAVAGELHTGFGGRGRRPPFPTPILWPIAPVRHQTIGNQGNPTGVGRVEMWRGDRRFGLSVAASFVWRCP